MLRRHEKVHGAGCNSIAFSPSGLHAATCGQDGVVRLWSTEDGTLASELKPAHAQTASSINCVAFSEEKGMVMGASNDRSIKTWDMHTGRPRFTMTGARTGCCTALASSAACLRDCMSFETCGVM